MRSLGIAILILGASGLVLAQGPVSCPTGDVGPVEVTPASGANGVTLGAPVRVRFSPAFFDDGVREGELRDAVELLDSEGVAVAGAWQLLGDQVVVIPSAPFVAYERYSGTASGAGRTLRFSFTTGERFDVAPPQFAGVESVISSPIEPSCESPDGGYRVSLAFVPAIDDGPLADIEYNIYLSRAAGLEAPELRERLRNFATDRITVGFALTNDEAASPVCVVVQAVDGVGKASPEAAPTCFDPVMGNYFAPLCSVEAPAGAPPWPVLAGLAILVSWRRGRRRALQSASS